jgi:hypothetical protein
VSGGYADVPGQLRNIRDKGRQDEPSKHRRILYRPATLG